MKIIISAIILFGSLTTQAHAYLDPGTGSVIISTIIAFFVAAWNYIKLYYNKFKIFIKKKFNKNN